MSAPTAVVHRDADTLAAAVAARLVTRLVDVQASQSVASVVLTGGGIGTAVLRAIRDSPARAAVDWSRLDVWWGDERFLPAGDDERNETQAREALLDAVALDPARVHAMPALTREPGFDVDTAAARYAAELAAAGGGRDAVPTFDVVLLGVGPDGHVASLFPGQPAVYDERPVVGVRNAPKPPPTRISMTFPALRAGWDVWLLAAGEAKAGAVRNGLSGAGEVQVPAAGARGRRRTLWLLDREAASRLPASLARLASP